MKDQKNILNYGFLIFLLIVGILSFFKNDDAFVNAINSLSFPIFLFTISTLLVKSNKFTKDYFLKAVSYQDKTVELLNETIRLHEELIEMKKKNGENVYEDKEKLADTLNDSIHSTALSNGFHKYLNTIEITTKIINVIAMFSFVFCLLSLMGLFSTIGNLNWINIFSLLLVFFDFFIFDDVMGFVCQKISSSIREKAEARVKKDLEAG